MNIRKQRQKEFAERWLNSDRRNILNLAPRMGKCFTSINIFEQFPPHATILIAYPDEKIKLSWEEDFVKREYSNPNITFVTHLSLHKYKDKIFDLIVIDEIHLLSENQINMCKELFVENKQILGLTGTLSSQTATILKKELSLNVEAIYPIELAIREGVITDYEIEVIKVPLDDKIIQSFKKPRTEKKQFDAYSHVINKMEEEGKNTMFLRLARMRIIQNSLSKLQKTKEFLLQWKDERILVFCGAIKIADKLGIPSHHSKNNKKQIFDDFVKGIGNQLAVIQIGNTGVTYLPLNKVIINYTNSNSEDLCQKIMRCLSIEYNNLDKKAHIYIISSTEPEELRWIKRALEFFQKDKIKYI